MVYNPTHTVNRIWARSNQATRCFKGLVNYEKTYEWYIGQMIESMIEQTAMDAELRLMLLDTFMPINDGQEKIYTAKQMQSILDCGEGKRKELRQKGEGKKFPFRLKELMDCIELKKKFPDVICGAQIFQHKCRKERLKIPFLFHTGETLLDTGGTSDLKNSNLYDAVALSSKRIGHGFSLMKHPELIKRCIRTKGDPGICIELCPTSNELLHLCRNVKEHPYPELLAAGIPCTVNTDNPNLYGNSMSHEFYQVMVGSQRMSVHSWRQLALWSFKYSCLDEKDKREGKRILMKDWEEFCGGVVEQFDHLFDVEGNTVNETLVKELYRLP
ncbi:Metallo-dependent hydrolase [Periconia macrospinosa]|uniref:Metallo-dependent hydrolase n=1 Tax=Periconia macrospinosa TaxID=97972 RepID=A0A2V1CZJ2_9PLEO|nr:Metallo-dependent hydrolase [Periconia macrospinosa]